MSRGIFFTTMVSALLLHNPVMATDHGISGVQSHHVLGGQPANYPEVVQMGIASAGEQISPSCSATVVSQSVVLTAAHCVQGFASFAAWLVDEFGNRALVPMHCIAHPGYSKSNIDSNRRSYKLLEPAVEEAWRRADMNAFNQGYQRWRRAHDAGEALLPSDGPRDVAACRFDKGELGPLRTACVPQQPEPFIRGNYFFSGYGYQLDQNGEEVAPPRDNSWTTAIKPKMQSQGRAGVTGVSNGVIDAIWRLGDAASTALGGGDSGGYFGFFSNVFGKLVLRGINSASSASARDFDRRKGKFCAIVRPVGHSDLVDLTTPMVRNEFLSRLPQSQYPINYCGQPEDRGSRIAQSPSPGGWAPVMPSTAIPPSPNGSANAPTNPSSLAIFQSSPAVQSPGSPSPKMTAAPVFEAMPRPNRQAVPPSVSSADSHAATASSAPVAMSSQPEQEKIPELLLDVPHNRQPQLGGGLKSGKSYRVNGHTYRYNEDGSFTWIAPSSFSALPQFRYQNLTYRGWALVNPGTRYPSLGSFGELGE